jgi:hypothetical protein
MTGNILERIMFSAIFTNIRLGFGKIPVRNFRQ